MNFNSFNLPISSDLIQAFSWTLIHSLWQGLLLAIATGLVLLASKKSRPALRYNLLTGLMLLFVTANGVTFYLEYNKSESVNAQINLISISNYTNIENASTGTITQHYGANWLHLFLDFCSSNAFMIVMVWLVVFLTKSVRAVMGMRYINQLRHERTFAVAEHWQQKIQQLATKLNMRSQVILMESEMVSVPAVIGFLKPLILVPVGFLASIPYAQVEAILLHELAHIRRRDFLVNLFQNFTESIYFFNPPLIWLSNLIREEREHCCDDLAIAVIDNKSAFVNALVIFQEQKLSAQRQAVAFAGKRNHLLDRIKRIIYNNNKQLDAMEKLFVTASVLTVTVLLAAFSPEIPKPPKAPKPPKVDIAAPPVPPVPLAPPAPCDTVPDPNGISEADSDVFTVHITRDNKRYEITEKHGKVTDLKINDKQIPQSKIADYLDEVNPILTEMKEESEKQKEEAVKLKEEAEELRIEATQLRIEAQALKQEALLMKEDAKNAKQRTLLMKDDIEAIKQQTTLNKEQALIIQEHAQKMRVNVEKQRNINNQINIDEFKSKAEKFRTEAEEIRKEALIIKEKMEVQKEEAEKIKLEYEKEQSSFLNDLKSEGLVKNKQSISYKISDSEFVLDGVKQPDAIHSKYKKKYLKQKDTEMVYNWRENSNTYTGYIHRK
jgi:bla regulator protein BlaR1